MEQLNIKEKSARNSVIMANVTLDKSKEALGHLKTNGGAIDLHTYRMERVNINAALKDRNLPQDLVLKWRWLKDTKAALQKIETEKTKRSVLTIAEMVKYMVRLWYYSSQIPWR
jgi:hypothetical protein